MSAADKLKLLLANCKAGVFITVNDHCNYYATAAQLIAEQEGGECPPQIAPEVRQRMVETDTIVTVRFYPQTPVGFYDIWHHDLDAALDEALECLREEGLLT